MIFFFSLGVLVTLGRREFEPEMMPPTSDNPYGSYNLIADEEMSFPSNAFQERPTELGSGDLQSGYFTWAAQNTSSINVLNTLPENDLPILKYDFDTNQIYVGSQSSMEPSEFIYRLQMDGVNLFGGGYIPYNDFFYVSTTPPQEPQP